LESKTIHDPVELIASLGGLHDVRIDDVTLNIEEQILALLVNDLYRNFEGTPEYPGERRCALLFHGITDLVLDVDINEGMRISELQVMRNTGSQKLFKLEVRLNIGFSAADVNIAASFTTLKILNS
jgi:hypothetical protein